MLFNDWLSKVLQLEKLVESGHGQRIADQNLGLGWLYYALVRIYRPRLTVVIGSWRGFVPIVVGKAMCDNDEGGMVLFIDPSLVDDFWMDPEKVAAYFAAHGAPNVVHWCMTTQEFATTEAYRNLRDVGLLFVDGLHTVEQVKFDHEAFMGVLKGPALFHDSRSKGMSTVYAESYCYSVDQYIAHLRDCGFSVLDIPLAKGVAVVLPPS
jgi:hypothetical protein